MRPKGTLSIDISLLNQQACHELEHDDGRLRPVLGAMIPALPEAACFSEEWKTLTTRL
jgi:hypothetical protein